MRDLVREEKYILFKTLAKVESMRVLEEQGFSNDTQNMKSNK